MKTDFTIVTMSEQILGKMEMEIKMESNIIYVHVEQNLYNITRIKDFQLDEEGNVLKYSVEISDWMNKKTETIYEFNEKDNSYFDLRDCGCLLIGKQLIFESFCACPEKFFKEKNGKVAVFDFITNMHTSLIYKCWTSNELNYIQIIAPVSIRMVFDKDMFMVGYEDLNSKIRYI